MRLFEIVLAINQAAGKLCGMNSTSTKLDLGNNESADRTISKNTDGTFTAVTFSASKTFKTYAGAIRWMASRAK